MVLHLTSIQQSPVKKTYRVYPVPHAGYELVESVEGHSDRVLCRFFKYDDAMMVAAALNRQERK